MASALALSMLFTMALLYATLSLPAALHTYLIEYFPDYGLAEWVEARRVVEALRPIGYVSLLTVTALVAAGFASKRFKASLLGSLAVDLPTFSYFASTMFFLAGVGLFRLLWIPFIDMDPWLLKLGHAVLLPYVALSILVTPKLAGLAFILAGCFVFSFGTATWLYGRSRGVELIDFWAYRLSRHPQYLGFLLWSYGLMVTPLWWGWVKGGYVPTPSLPWLLAALIVMTVALSEEALLTKRFGERYIRYREAVPFLFPAPRKLRSATARPIKLLLDRPYPTSVKEAFLVTVLYGALLIASSIPVAYFLP